MVMRDKYNDLIACVLRHCGTANVHITMAHLVLGCSRGVNCGLIADVSDVSSHKTRREGCRRRWGHG